MNKIDVKLVHHGMSEGSISRVAGISRSKSTYPSVEDLIRWGHLSPLEFGSVTFLIRCPIFVARQLERYRTGSYMEKSLRYTTENSVYLPPSMTMNMAVLASHIFDVYESALDQGVAKEDARIILPLGTMTELYAQYDMRNFIHLAKERLDKHAEPETRETVNLMVDEMTPFYPSIAKHIKGE